MHCCMLEHGCGICHMLDMCVGKCLLEFFYQIQAITKIAQPNYQDTCSHKCVILHENFHNWMKRFHPMSLVKSLFFFCDVRLTMEAL